MSEIKATQVLQSALDALQNRAAIRDQPNGERSAARAAAILRAWTGRDVEEVDVWRTLLAVKLSRESQGQFHADDLIDLAGYSALLAECRSSVEGG